MMPDALRVASIVGVSRTEGSRRRVLMMAELFHFVEPHCPSFQITGLESMDWEVAALSNAHDCFALLRRSASCSATALACV